MKFHRQRPIARFRFKGWLSLRLQLSPGVALQWFLTLELTMRGDHLDDEIPLLAHEDLLKRPGVGRHASHYRSEFRCENRKIAKNSLAELFRQ